LEADVLLYGGTDTPHYHDAQVLDPASLAGVRRHGVDFAIWRTSYEPQWQEKFARARALELRMYVVVFDEGRNRAYAVDPDGAILCGTFDGYEIASFTYDPARTAQTFVAPGTDVLAGLNRAALHATP
jgi:predicted amidohydrolase